MPARLLEIGGEQRVVDEAGAAWLADRVGNREVVAGGGIQA